MANILKCNALQLSGAQCDVYSDRHHDLQTPTVKVCILYVLQSGVPPEREKLG